MPEFTTQGLAIYLLIINLLAVAVTIYDKHAAITDKWRISEKQLLTIAILGGAVSMLVIMQTIRHKTRDKKFMVGLPLIIAIQIIVYFMYYN